MASINIGGTWKTPTPAVNIVGAWRPSTIWVNAGGVWKNVSAVKFTVLAAIQPSGSFIGYQSGSYGSVSGTTTIGGGTLFQCSNTATDGRIVIAGLSADPGQAFFKSLTVGLTTNLTSLSTYSYNTSSGRASWDWGQFGFFVGNSYPCILNF